ncbi:MAG: OB-fold domain-containing protein [Syntrophorhabdales bacterium]|jgi:hypothetical protein
MAQKKAYPVYENLFTWPSDEPQLIAGRCRTCGTYYFPRSYVMHHPECKNREATEDVLLSREGKLDSYTVQCFPPPPPFKNPDPFVPYGIGWVSVPEGLSILGIITGCKPEEIKMHMDVKLVVEKVWEDSEGNDVVTWKWKKI